MSIFFKRCTTKLLTALLVCACSAAVALSESEYNPVITDVSKIKGIDFTGLSDAQKKLALKVMNEHYCTAGCQHTIAACRAQEGGSCRRCLIFARTIVDSIRSGKDEAGVVHDLKRKADMFVEVRQPDDQGVVYDIDVSLNPVRGPKEAPVTIVEFSDFQCPYAAGAQRELERAMEAFPNDVRLVFKQFPLDTHQYAWQAAHASLAAFSQGKFWEMHDKLFQNFSTINSENLTAWAREIGLDMDDYDECMLSSKYGPMIQKDMADAAAAKVMGTPTLFINGKRIRNRSFESLKKAIEKELADLRTSDATKGQ